MARIKRIITNPDQGTVTFAWANGEADTFAVGDLPEGIQHRLALHGLAQKLADAHAGADDVAAARAATTAVWETLQAGEWTKRPADTGAALLVAAVARVKRCDVAEAAAAVERLPADRRKALERHPAVRAAMAAIRAERLAARAAEAPAPELPV